MKRTPSWVFVAAVGVQLAALGLCLWAMEQNLRAHEEEADAEEPAPEPPQPQAELRREALAAAPPLTAADVHFAYSRPPAPDRRPEPVPQRGEPTPWHWPQASPAEVVRPVPPPEPPGAPVDGPPPEHVREEPPPRQVIVRAAQRPPETSPAPLFGPPPERPPDADAAPRFITEAADATTQIVRGRLGDGEIAFGFYPDGNIRFVDVDAGRYAGKAESARARMREVDGLRAFTVQIGVGVDQRLQATFTGGPHDAQTIALEPLVGWSVA